jgi:hypothetical protein
MRGCPFAEAHEAPWHAAQSGSVALMAWVLQRPGTRLAANVMAAAAKKGDIAMCQYLYGLQCSWDADSTSKAVLSGHVSLLRWLVENGCRCNVPHMCMKAAENGSVEILAYLQQQGYLTSTTVLTNMLRTAGSSNKLTAAKWLRKQGAEWPTAFGWPRWSDEVLAWARAEGCTTPV